MKYKDAIKQSMEMLAENENTIFLGYNIRYGSKAYGTLTNISNNKKIETPVAENLMVGLATGLALEGYRPIIYFERHDFMLNALDGIVNHLSKIERMSAGDYKTPVTIRAVIGSRYPLNPGPQHTQDFTEAFKKMIDFPIYEPKTSSEVIKTYEIVKNSKRPLMVIERRDLYEEDFK